MIYLSTFFYSESLERYMAVTQFVVADARKCFPCFDEPKFKATFSIAIAAPKDLDILSNAVNMIYCLKIQFYFLYLLIYRMKKQEKFILKINPLNLSLFIKLLQCQLIWLLLQLENLNF